jgi:hypothetical protein
VPGRTVIASLRGESSLHLASTVVEIANAPGVAGAQIASRLAATAAAMTTDDDRRCHLVRSVDQLVGPIWR